ncbi:MAG: hypothetical protein ABI776_15010 [Nocardioidaceae bacterium]
MTEKTQVGAEDVAGIEEERRRRREAIFGDVLPDGTTDERADGSDGSDGSEGSDEWLRRQVPPHHG